MTVHVPKWLLWGLAVTATAGAIVAAFLLGRSSDQSSPTTSPATRTGEPSEEPPRSAAQEAVCSKATAETATLDTEFDDKIRDYAAVRAALESSEPADIPFFTDNLVDYQVGVLECADLTGDSISEMVVGLSAGAAGRVFQWAIFTPDERGHWTLAFDREGVATSSIEIEGDSVLTLAPIYGRNDPLCCPSGHRPTRVAFRAGEFRIVAPVAPQEKRIIVLDNGRVTRLGPLRPASDTPDMALTGFGTPTTISNYPDDACNLTWGDSGLSITFADFGGGDPCSSDGRIASFDLAGTAAAQAGWHTAEGARIGMGVAELEGLFPESSRTGSEMTLIETPSPLGPNGEIPVMTAHLVDGIALAFHFYVGAAGE